MTNYHFDQQEFLKNILIDIYENNPERAVKRCDVERSLGATDKQMMSVLKLAYFYSKPMVELQNKEYH